ncbi:hypothetical protein AHAS_Ahas01G0300200 [Arachis hypogaea]
MVRFKVKDIYNAIEKQRKAGASDTDNALKYLQIFKSRDLCMFWKYSLDEQQRLHNIFWCDGTSQYDFIVFEDKEWEKSYVWLPRAFLNAMKGKAHKSIITDDDQAMKSAIKVVFPEMHDSLRIWVATNSWDKDMYEKKHMWSNAHIRDKFFAVLKTTSRFGCENKIGGIRAVCSNSIHTTGLVLLREVLLLASNVRVVSLKKTKTCTLFELAMYCQDSLIQSRWTKKAKQPPMNNHIFSGEIPDATYMSMHAAILDDCRELVKLSCSYFENYFEVKTKIANEREALREKI